MKKISLLLLSALTLGGLVACGNGDTPSGSKDLTLDEAKTLVSGFEKSVTGVVSVEYKAKFTLDVESEKSGMESFERDTDDTTVFDLDLTSGSLYLYGKTTGKSKATDDVKTSEALVWSESGTYYYLTSTMGEKKSLASESEALSKIDELMSSLSKENAGEISTASLLYSGINDYEHKAFLLDSSNIYVEDMDDPTSMKKNSSNGIDVTSKLTYVGYYTDAGTSELSCEAGNEATVSTNDKGYVTSFSIQYNDAQLSMPIMTPAPLLHLNGTRTMTATYGSSIVRKDTIDHEAAKGTVEIPDSFTGGTVEVKTCAPNDFTHMSDVKTGDQVDVGNWLCIKPTPAGSNSIKNVMVNSNSQPIGGQAFNGWYCFEVVEGTNKVVVNFEGSDVVSETAKVTWTTGEHVTSVSVSWFVLSAPTAQTPIENGGSVDLVDGLWLFIKPVVEDGYTASVKCNGTDVAAMYGGYCQSVKTAGDYAITVEATK